MLRQTQILWSVRPFVLPSFYPSVLKFYWDWLINFSETQHGFRDPCVVVSSRARFVEKNLVAQKVGENGLKIGFFIFIGQFTH